MNDLKSFVFAFILGSMMLSGCKHPYFNDFEELPKCVYTRDEKLKFSKVELKAPGNELLHYNNIYNGTITSLRIVLGSHTEQSKSEIKVSSKVSGGCTEKKSPLDLYNKNQNLDKVESKELKGVTGYANAKNGFPEVTVEVTSGPHVDMMGNEGTVLWTKKMPVANPYAYATFEADGRFMITKSAISQPLMIYNNDRFIEYVY